MANISYQDTFWQVRASLPGAPLPLVFAAYLESVRDFFKRSLAWQFNVADPMDVPADTAFPTVTAGTHIPATTYVVQPVRLKWIDGSDITFKTRDQLDEIDPQWETKTGSAPIYWTITSPGVFRLYPLLDDNADDSLVARFALSPTTGSKEIPEELANEFQDAWSHGALARLLVIPGKDWTDPKLGGYYIDMFESDIVKAKSRAAADFGRPYRTVRYGGLSMGGSGRKIIDDYGQ